MRPRIKTEERETIGVTRQVSLAVRNTSKMERAADEDFDRIFIEHWPRVYAVLVRLVGDQDEAEDLALETFWRLHLQLGAGRIEALGGWLYRVASNLGLNALRARKRRARHELEAGQEALQRQAEADPVDALSAAEEQARVRATLAQMDERQATLLLLRYSGLDYRELATVMRVAPGSIGNLLLRAEREFEKKYRDGGPYAH